MELIMSYLMAILIGLAASGVVALLAYYKKALDRSGAITAVLIGTVIYVTGGWLFVAILLTFFLSGSILSRIDGTHTPHPPRTYKQVLANGLVGMVLSVLFAITDDNLYRVLYAVSFAVSTADTWAGEIGKWSRQKPRDILSLKQVDVGLSGGVTWLGMAASVLGSLVISAFVGWSPYVVLFGFFGSVVDSLMGTVQVKYVASDGTMMEHPDPNDAENKTVGLSFLTNNLVNALSNLLVVLLAFVVLILV